MQNKKYAIGLYIDGSLKSLTDIKENKSKIEIYCYINSNNEEELINKVKKFVIDNINFKEEKDISLIAAEVNDKGEIGTFKYLGEDKP